VLVLGLEQLVASRLPFLAGSDPVLGHVCASSSGLVSAPFSG
jgi:hypothetical protein